MKRFTALSALMAKYTHADVKVDRTGLIVVVIAVAIVSLSFLLPSGGNNSGPGTQSATAKAATPQPSATKAATPQSSTTKAAIPQAGELQLQFREGVVERKGVLRNMVAIKNTTNINYATVAWSCDLYDDEGYKIGAGTVLMHGVYKNAITVDTQYFYSNDTKYPGAIKCRLSHVEEQSVENERLYRRGPQQHSVRLRDIDDPRWWDDRQAVNGRAVARQPN